MYSILNQDKINLTEWSLNESVIYKSVVVVVVVVGG